MSRDPSSPPGGGDPATPPPPSVAVHRAGTAVVVAIRGELHAGTVLDLHHILWDLICDQGNLHVAVDVGAVSDADPASVAELAGACRLARDHNATLALVNVPPAIAPALDPWRHEGLVIEDDVGAFCSGSDPGASMSEGPGGLDRAGDPAALDDHVVEFYLRDDHLADSVRGFLLPALARGQAALVVATDDHRRAFDEELRAAGADVDHLRRQRRYLSLDARETLARFMVGDMPDGPRFESAVGGLVRGMAARCGGVRVFGEMVAVLWADGNVGAAIALEDLWNDLRSKETFELLCAYPTWLFERDDATEPFQRVCDQHTRVVPSERIAVEQGALRAVALLEQRVDPVSAARRALAKQSHELKEDLTRHTRGGMDVS